MTRPFQFFTVYDFFSVFLPGLATLLGAFALLPRPIEVGPLGALVPTLVLSFVFGQALHSLSSWLEKLLGRAGVDASHEARFAAHVEGLSGTRLGDRFREECAAFFRDPSLLSARPDASPDWASLYPFVLSHVYSRDGGRSATFQAISAFSRSMLVLLAGLPLVYLGHHRLRRATILVDRPPKYLLYFPNYGEFVEAVWPLSWLGAALFLYATYSYKRYFVQYLVADFVALRGGE